MNQNLTHRKATIVDLRTIVNLLLEDELRQTREQFSAELDQLILMRSTGTVKLREM